MNKLRKKIFWAIFGILSVALLSFLLVFNIQNYQEQRSIVKRSMSFNIMAGRVPSDSFNRNIRFMDANVITVRLDKYDNIVEIINHTNEDLDNTNITELANSILKNKNKEKEHIGFLYLEKYSYSYHEGSRLIIVDNSIVQDNLNIVLRNSVIFLIVLELIFITISKLISNWISEPVEEAFNKQKEFIADASHELKTPLSVITASAEALEKSPKEKKWLTNIKNESDRMNNLIVELLDLAKTENGNIKLSMANLSKVVELTVLTFEVKAFEKNIKLDYHIDKGKKQLKKLTKI